MVKVKNAKSKKIPSGKRSSDPKKKNPFEVHVNRQKHDIIGRKLKHDKGLPGVARTKAIKKRKATLLQEYKHIYKSNEFVDRRIGERNSAMTAEDRITARFAAERAKAQRRKNSIFNLADDEVLTHKGQTLNEIEKFDDPRSDDEEEDRGKLEADFVSDLHFGGGFLRKKEDSDMTKLSRQNLIQQLISESKKRKAEKQRESEKTAALTDKLDAAWKDLQPIVYTAKKKAKTEEDENPEPKPKMDSYDLAVRELKFEARGKPSDRLKSEEEIALEEKERLEKLEAERVQRMHGILEGTKPKVTHRSADDLDDGFELEENADPLSYDESGQLVQSGSGMMEAETLVASDDEDVEEEEPSEDEEDEDEEENSEESEDDLEDLKYGSSDEEDTPVKLPDTSKVSNSKTTINENKAAEEKTFDADKFKVDLQIWKETMEKARKELPYTFQAPETYESLQSTLEGREICEQSVVLERMIKCTHPSLGAGNRERLGTLFAFLLQWLHDSAIETTEVEFGVNPNKELMNALLPHLFDLAQLSGAGNARRCMAAILTEKYEEWTKNGGNMFPGFDTLIFFQLVPHIFPASDFRHPVTSPALVMMANILTSCKVTSLEDIRVGLYICQTVLQYTVLSKRFLPEAFRFLISILSLTVPDKPEEKILSEYSPPGSHENGGNRFLESGSISYPNGKEIHFVDMLEVTLTILLEMVEQVKDSIPCWSNIITPAVQILDLVPPLTLNRFPKSLTEKIKNLKHHIQEVPKLEKLVSEKKKPKPLKMFEPVIEKVYDGKRKAPMSEKKRERLKLTHKVKKEMKGAIREIRRDRTFLAKIKLKEMMKSDSERKEKVKEIMGSLSMQAGELNKLDRQRKKK